MKPTQLLTALAALALPFAAAADYSYSWFEVGYIADAKQETPNNASNKGDGFDARINFLAGDLVYLTGYIDEISVDNDTDMDRFGLGFGIHNDFSANLGMYGTVTYEDFESSFLSDNGFGLTLGLRYNVQEDFEAFGGIKHSSYDHMDAFFFNIGGVWAFSQNYALVAEYTDGEFSVDDGINQDLDRADVRLALRVQF